VESFQNQIEELILPYVQMNLERERSLIRQILNVRMSPSQIRSNNLVDGNNKLPATLKSYLYARIGEAPPEDGVVQDPWGPPALDALEDYSDAREEAGTELNQFGRFNGEDLVVDLSGYVEVVDPLDFMGLSNRRGWMTMDIRIAPNVRTQMRMFVMGTVFGTGTAVLVDGDLNVWLWNSEDTSNYPLKDWDIPLAKVLKSGCLLSARDDLAVLESYQEICGVEWDEIKREPLWVGE
jgi:hypothetical protein